jgi:hypothetical protein
MTYTYDLNTHGVLVLRADEQEREWLRELIGPVGEYGETNRPYLDVEFDALEPLICNSDLEWIRPEEIGALTSAPILGFCDRDEHGEITNVRGAWGFMDYALRSFVDDLISTGKAVFIS